MYFNFLSVEKFLKASCLKEVNALREESEDINEIKYIFTRHLSFS